MSYATEGGFRRAFKGKHRDLEMFKPNMTEDEEAYQEHRSIQHPKQDYEYGQKSWELMGGRCQDEWDLKNGHRKERKYEELMRDRNSRKTVMRNTNDDMEEEENNRRKESLCNPPHNVHVDAICPIARGMFE